MVGKVPGKGGGWVSSRLDTGYLQIDTHLQQPTLNVYPGNIHPLTSIYWSGIISSLFPCFQWSQAFQTCRPSCGQVNKQRLEIRSFTEWTSTLIPDYNPCLVRANVQFANMIHPFKSSLAAHPYPNIPTISCTDISREEGNTREIWQSAEEVEEPSPGTLSSLSHLICPSSLVTPMHCPSSHQPPQFQASLTLSFAFSGKEPYCCPGGRPRNKQKKRKINV